MTTFIPWAVCMYTFMLLSDDEAVQPYQIGVALVAGLMAAAGIDIYLAWFSK